MSLEIQNNSTRQHTSSTSINTVTTTIENNNDEIIETTIDTTSNTTDKSNQEQRREEEQNKNNKVEEEQEEIDDVSLESSTIPLANPHHPQLTINTVNTNNNSSSDTTDFLIQDEEFNLPSSKSLISIYSASSLLEELAEESSKLRNKFSFNPTDQEGKTRAGKEEQQEEEEDNNFYCNNRNQNGQDNHNQKEQTKQNQGRFGKKKLSSSWLFYKIRQLHSPGGKRATIPTRKNRNNKTTSFQKRLLHRTLSRSSNSNQSSSTTNNNKNTTEKNSLSFSRFQFGFLSTSTKQNYPFSKITSSTKDPNQQPVVIQEDSRNKSIGEEDEEEGIESSLLLYPKTDYSSTTTNNSGLQVQIHDTKTIIAEINHSPSSPSILNYKPSESDIEEQQQEQHLLPSDQEEEELETSHMENSKQEHINILQNNPYLIEAIDQGEKEEDCSNSNDVDSDISFATEGEDYNIEPSTSQSSSTQYQQMRKNHLRMDLHASSSISPIHSMTSNPQTPLRRSSSNTGTTTATMCRTCISKCLYHNPVMSCILSIKTVSDYLPSIPQTIMENPKMSFLGLLVSCFLFNLLVILPGYLFSFLVTEVGVYVINIIFIWCTGRFVLRLIAFPGSTSRVAGEIETEFSKYSLRMIENSLDHVIEFCLLIISMEDVSMYNQNDYNSDSSNENVFSPTKTKRSAVQKLVGISCNTRSTPAAYSSIITAWRKVEQYRNRVLGMFFEVLHCLLHENGQGEAISEDDDLNSQVKTKYANNKLVGDIGHLISSVSKKGREDGEQFYQVLRRVLSDMDNLETCASELFGLKANDVAKSNNHLPRITIEAFRAAQRLLISASDLKDMIPSMSIQNESSDEIEQEEANINASHPILSNNTVIKAIISTIELLVTLFDPPPHKSIFGLDVLRGSMLCRYLGARQLWCPRLQSDGGGMIDVIHIPSNVTNGTKPKNRYIEKAVLFCNPNAGLIEVATGISLIGGNVAFNSNAAPSWADFYTENGFDIFLFNYSGFGRSHVGNRRSMKEKSTTPISIIGRIIYKCLFGPTPSPSHLKADALAVANFMIKEYTINKMIIHGESIGGMAAASAARNLSTIQHKDEMTSVPKSYPTLLLCDRTFCNLNAVASHLVGSWTTPIIPILVPFWNTDVAGDFIAATCKKVVAQDAADAIIHYSSSLQKGVATAKELKKGVTKRLERVIDTPLHYLMADFENVGVNESNYISASKSLSHIQGPVWPSDKHVDFREAMHFAACARRIGKVATSLRKRIHCSSMDDSRNFDDEEGIEITTVFSRDKPEQSNHIDCKIEKEDAKVQVWETMSRCDGLTGLPLGVAVKEGDDCIIDWLTSFTIFGGQRLVLQSKKRSKGQPDLAIQSEDFHVNYKGDNDDDNEEEIKLPPLPLPEVINQLKLVYHHNDTNLFEIEKELEYCIRMLEYVFSRLTATITVTSMNNIINFRDNFDGISTGRFLNLDCGHNNQYSLEEKMQLCDILIEACANSEDSFA